MRPDTPESTPDIISGGANFLKQEARHLRITANNYERLAGFLEGDWSPEEQWVWQTAHLAMVPPPFGVSDMAAALQLDKRKATELRDDLIGRGILNPVQQGLAIHHLIRKPLLRKVLEIYPAAFWQTYGQLVAHYQVSEGQSKRVQELNNYRLEVLRGVVEEIRKEAAPSAEK